MTRQISSKSEVATAPLYSLIWERIKLFPQGLAAGSQTPLSSSGPAAAALISAGFGCFVMMLNQHLTVIFKVWDNVVWTMGSWIPGSHHPSKLYGEIGSYSGKETILLVGWLVSWLILYQLWRHRDIKARTIFFWLLAFFVAATAMSWHPLFPYLPLMPTK